MGSEDFLRATEELTHIARNFPGLFVAFARDYLETTSRPPAQAKIKTIRKTRRQSKKGTAGRIVADFVAANPGSTIRDIMNATELGRSSVSTVLYQTHKAEYRKEESESSRGGKKIARWYKSTNGIEPKTKTLERGPKESIKSYLKDHTTAKQDEMLDVLAKTVRTKSKDPRKILYQTLMHMVRTGEVQRQADCVKLVGD